MSDIVERASWEVEGFIERLSCRTDMNSERLVLEAISHLRAFAEDCDALRDRNREMAAEIERLQEALSNIQTWAEAYPIDIFHEPTPEECRRVHELLTANGMTLDAFSASMGRHCLRGVGDIARAALKAAEA